MCESTEDSVRLDSQAHFLPPPPPPPASPRGCWESGQSRERPQGLCGAVGQVGLGLCSLLLTHRVALVKASGLPGPPSPRGRWGITARECHAEATAREAAPGKQRGKGSEAASGAAGLRAVQPPILVPSQDP